MIKSTGFLTAILIAATALSQFALAEDGPAVADTAEATQPLDAGESIPVVSVKDASGQPVALKTLHQDRPVVLVFFRGGWCPICTRHTRELIKIYPEIKAMGADLVGISPDSPMSSKANVAKNAIPFQVLSDADVAATKAFGLAFEVDPTTLERYKGFGIDLEKASGFSHHALPIPAVYIVRPTGVIAFAHSDPNYRKRLDAKQILQELRKLN